MSLRADGAIVPYFYSRRGTLAGRGWQSWRHHGTNTLPRNDFVFRLHVNFSFRMKKPPPDPVSRWISDSRVFHPPEISNLEPSTTP